MKRLRELRGNFGFTQKQMADYLNIDQSNYSKIELGKKKLNLILLEKICSLFNCSEEYLLGQSNEYETSTVSFRKNKCVDLNVIAKMNETMHHLKLLNKIDKEE